RGTVAPRHPAVAPARERDDDGIEVVSLLGEAVLEAARALRVRHAREDAVLDELVEPVGEPVTAGAEVGVEVPEPAHAEKGVTQDEQRPAVTDDGQGAGDGTGQVADVAPPHRGRTIGSKLELSKGPGAYFLRRAAPWYVARTRDRRDEVCLDDRGHIRHARARAAGGAGDADRRGDREDRQRRSLRRRARVPRVEHLRRADATRAAGETRRQPASVLDGPRGAPPRASRLPLVMGGRRHLRSRGGP